ncbi:MAG: RHS repeat-associated core domain-containing protein, partial [Nitrospirae bacterium]|nr:RHS repeat-associated core domain-containing protein [Nitrospirota bacterium]
TNAKGNVNTLNYYPNNIDVQNIKLDLVTTPGNDDITLKTFTYNGITHDAASITDRLGNISGLTYTTNGQLSSITQAKGTAVEMRTDMIYDPATHELTEINKSSNTVASFTYDNVGRVRTSTDDKGLLLTYDYDNLDQITKITYPDSRVDTFNYAACCPHMIDSITDRAGLTTIRIYDSLKRLTEVQAPGGTIKYEYDINGNRTKLIDADGKATSFQYDLDNKLVKKIYADGNFEQYEYDLAGLPTKITNSRGIEKIYSYNANHNLVSINYSDTTPDITLTYDAYDLPDTMTDGIGVYDYGYDNLNRLASIDGPWVDDTISFQYNDLGHVKSMSPQNGQAITYNYDYDSGYADLDIGRLKEIQAGTNIYTYGYPGVNPLVQSLTRTNGSLTEYLYNDPLKRLTEINNKDSVQQIINKHAFTYNNLDVIDTETIETGTQLDSFTAGLTIYNYNNLNQLLSSTNPSQTFLYDADGNMTQGYTPDGYVMAMTYDAENRLTAAEYTDSSTVVHRTEYYYSGDGLLAELKKFEDYTITNIIRFVRAGFLPIQERDENNQIVNEYTWGLDMGGGIGGLLNLNQSGQDYSYLYDGKGNVMAVIDGNQQVAASYRYDVFGMPLKKVATLDQPFRFSTKQYDERTGLSYYGYRFYNPSIGRWITRDPLGEAGGINLYGFVGNNPVNFVDPLGLENLRRPDSRYYFGRLGSWIEPGRAVGSYLEDHVTHAHQTAKIHDRCVDTLHNLGVPDIIANYPTMIPAFGAAVIYNNLTDYSQPQQDNIIFFQLNW